MTEIAVVYEGDLSTKCIFTETGQAIMTDAPKDNHGKGEMFSPTDLVAAALGSCVLTIMAMLAKRLNADLTGTKLYVTKEMQQAPSRRIGKLKVIVKCPKQFDPETIKRLEKAAEQCPVHQSLHPEVIQEFVFEWGVS